MGFDAVRIAYRSIVTSKLRSGLTMLGVIIGVAAVVGLVSVSQGATDEVLSVVEGLGSNVITVTGSGQFGIVMGDAEQLVERSPAVIAGAPVINLSTELSRGTIREFAQVEGTIASYAGIRGFELASGRFLSDDDVSNDRRVVVLGAGVAEELFTVTQPVGETIGIAGRAYTVIGVIESVGGGMGLDDDHTVWIPVGAAGMIVNRAHPSMILLQAESREMAPLAVSHIQRIYETRYRGEERIRIMSQDEILSALDTMSATLSLLLGAIAGISLVVGGIGIMNIMLTSVAERTREIGIRKAVGAGSFEICAQFLVESVILSLTGGLLGIALGAMIASGIAYLANWSTVVTGSAVVTAILLASGVGIVFGVYPALKAAKLHPIAALRVQ